MSLNLHLHFQYGKASQTVNLYQTPTADSKAILPEFNQVGKEPVLSRYLDWVKTHITDAEEIPAYGRTVEQYRQLAKTLRSQGSIAEAEDYETQVREMEQSGLHLNVVDNARFNLESSLQSFADSQEITPDQVQWEWAVW